VAILGVQLVNACQPYVHDYSTLAAAEKTEIGDSITAGIGTGTSHSDSYRRLLLTKHPELVGVGSFAKSGLLFNAVSGQKSDFILAHIAGWALPTVRPLGILMIGHNDPIVVPTIAPAQSAANIAGIIAAAQGIVPGMRFLVTAPVNATAPWDIYNADYSAIEAALPAALAGLAGVTLMTPRPTFVPGDYLDGEHFNAAGCAKFEAFIEPYVIGLGY
jgi:lysophospholipase L1-like esterase